MRPTSQSHLYLYLKSANHKYITHKIWRSEGDNILRSSSYDYSEPSGFPCAATRIDIPSSYQSLVHLFEVTRVGRILDLFLTPFFPSKSFVLEVWQKKCLFNLILVLTCRCIYESWKCDNTNDCEDNSDEADCPPTLSIRVVTAAVIGSLICGLLLVIGKVYSKGHGLTPLPLVLLLADYFWAAARPDKCFWKQGAIWRLVLESYSPFLSLSPDLIVPIFLKEEGK